MKIDGKPNLGLDQVVDVAIKLGDLYNMLLNLSMSCQDVGLVKIHQDTLYIAKKIADARRTLEKSHTILVNDLVQDSERATINMIAAAIASVTPMKEDKL